MLCRRIPRGAAGGLMASEIVSRAYRPRSQIFLRLFFVASRPSRMTIRTPDQTEQAQDRSDMMSQTTAPRTPGIQWPEQHLPAKSDVFCTNEIVIPAPAHHIWPWLLRAEAWPSWYTNSHDVHFLSHAGPDLRDRSRFRWNTFGLRITCKVKEFEPCSRLAWDAQGIGVEAYHAWLLTPLPNGSTHVLTEETQTGWLARIGKKLMPNRMHDMHQIWLESLSLKAIGGPPV